VTRLRVGLSITIMIGALYAAAGLFDSLTKFGVGICVAATAVIGYGLLDFLDSHQDEQTARGRDAVWARRDEEAKKW